MDYRTSHQNPTKGRSYAESFKKYPYRRIVWEWEKNVLYGIIQDILREKHRIKYLDFACGTGRILSFLEKYMEESHGVDVSEPMLNVAKENVSLSNLLLVDLTTKEDVFPENYFDLITAFRFFLNAQQDLRESVLRVFGKLLKKDGYLILNIHMNKGCLLEKELRTYQMLKGYRNQNFNSLSVQEIKTLLRGFNFKNVQSFHYGVLPIYKEEHKLFLNQINYIEQVLSRFPSLTQVSRYVIYVCRFTNRNNL
jgi:ubiquinone/menaquinone biosynthesis C-methylase UbiE